ncbi:2-oxoglutarate dehydrogenase E1 component, partial [hydrothermal vent metagenome]
MMAEQIENEEFSSFLSGANAVWLEGLLARYQQDPNSVDAQWRSYFASLQEPVKSTNAPSWARENWPVAENGELVSALDGDWPQVEEEISEKIKSHPANGSLNEGDINQATRDSVSAIMMIRAYRMRGHLHADLDPLKITSWREAHNDLHPSTYGFTDADYDRPIFIDYMLGLEFASVREMLEILNRTYCSTMGIEFMHISNPQEKAWIQERIEGPDKGVAFTEMGKKAILAKLVEAEGFERFLDVKYKGTKRFGLDGGESLIPALEQIIKRGGQLGLEEIILGMPHRGRLNVLASVM